MRREYTDNYIDWLKSLGCVLYLPLSYDGDLQDRISGESLQLTGYGSMVWDNTQNMYKITSPSSYQQWVAVLNSPFNHNLFPEDNYTYLSTVKKITSSSTKRITGLYPINNKTSAISCFIPAWNGSSTSSTFPSYIANSAIVVDYTNRRRMFYQDGALYNTYYSGWELPSDWNETQNGLVLAKTYQDSQKLSVQFYTKELYVFNKVLDLSTIRKIQGYE